ncbi:MAG: FliI/YscN family ATPase [Deltaproteobacteria bacterium]|nr:FliI/YscN family ATPase [Deltaproteobacteria bacterium]
MPEFARLTQRLEGEKLFRYTGQVVSLTGMVIEGDGPPVSIGDLCRIENPATGSSIICETVGFRERRILLMPLGNLQGVAPGNRIFSLREPAFTAVGEALLGRVIDGQGRPLDQHGAINCPEKTPLHRDPINPFQRRRIDAAMDLGIRSINGLLTCGQGQRLGIMAGSGVGKSVLLGMMARYTRADINVIGLIGERGREVREFIERDLGEEGLKRSIVVVATSDQPPLVRLRGAFLATAIAEYFRDRGRAVLLMMDSLTRFAMAQREIGLAVGEPPTSKGYPPSVFSLLPKLLERAGRNEGAGSITGLYTVLVEGDDLSEPIADATRSILDGHIVLSRRFADRNIFPAIDPLKSKSRVMIDIVKREQTRLAGEFLNLMAAYDEAEDLINIGAYVKGSNPRIDRAIALRERILAYLRQEIGTPATLADSINALEKLMQG